ncbi:excalibur calcium-binding domain-containing protein [Streptomyces canus]|uniref:excalibur calcium-binding domain-containing protein n=1 Tax=Streptomyces canus TaxID=58343 RepID=UPI00386E0C72
MTPESEPEPAATVTVTAKETVKVSRTVTAQAEADTGSGSDADSGSTHYANCTEARAAGAAPVHRGEPGYASHLDRDNDGVACDS